MARRYEWVQVSMFAGVGCRHGTPFRGPLPSFQSILFHSGGPDDRQKAIASHPFCGSITAPGLNACPYLKLNDMQYARDKVTSHCTYVACGTAFFFSLLQTLVVWVPFMLVSYSEVACLLHIYSVNSQGWPRAMRILLGSQRLSKSGSGSHVCLPVSLKLQVQKACSPLAYLSREPPEKCD